MENPDYIAGCKGVTGEVEIGYCDHCGVAIYKNDGHYIGPHGIFCKECITYVEGD